MFISSLLTQNSDLRHGDERRTRKVVVMLNTKYLHKRSANILHFIFHATTLKYLQIRS